jgi:hypothetical protein
MPVSWPTSKRKNAPRSLLWAKYPQFGDSPEEGAGPVMALDVTDWSGWAYAED